MLEVERHSRQTCDPGWISKPFSEEPLGAVWGGGGVAEMEWHGASPQGRWETCLETCQRLWDGLAGNKNRGELLGNTDLMMFFGPGPGFAS